MAYTERTTLGLNDLILDAWERQKTIIDYSLFHSTYTYGISNRIYGESINGGALSDTFTNLTVLNGKAVIPSGATNGDSTIMQSYESPRYQPNRGHLYSTSVFLPTPEIGGTRNFGLGTSQSGVFFRLKNGVLYGVIRTTIDGDVVNSEYPITLPNGVDLSKGNVFDIQYQWRGVGNYKFFINLKEVLEVPYLSTRTELSMINPANPIFFESINAGGTPCRIEVGCVDITSEGGKKEGLLFGSIGTSTDSGSIAITGLNIPIIAFRGKSAIGSLINTRDANLFNVLGYANQKSVLRVWKTRDLTAITEGTQTWTDFGDGFFEYIEYNNPEAVTAMTFDTTKAELVTSARIQIDSTYNLDKFNSGTSEFLITPSDLIIVTIHRENGIAVDAGAVISFGEKA